MLSTRGCCMPSLSATAASYLLLAPIATMSITVQAPTTCAHFIEHVQCVSERKDTGQPRHHRMK
uniref:Secreted protein n=1 Tax=Arundo donax TaxID=35708 RepID=A0A0A8Z2Q1_ARUDO